MAFPSGKLNYRIRHQRNTPTAQGDAGATIDSWATLATYWGGVTSFDVQAEGQVGAAVTDQNAAIVKMKFHPGILASDRFLAERDGTTLSAGVNSSTTTIPLTAALNFDGGDVDYLAVGSEVMRVTAGTTSLTVERGAIGTTAASHSSGATAQRVELFNIVGIDRADSLIDEFVARVARNG